MLGGTYIRAAAKASLRWGGLGCVLVVGLTGCRHKTVLAPLPPVSQPVVLVNPPEPDPPPMIPKPQIDLPPVPVASGATPHRERRRKTTAAQPATPASQPAAQADIPQSQSPENAAIGSLSLGGEAGPQAQQEAVDLIGAIDGRLHRISAQKASADRALINRIRNFRRQAQEALNSGDIEGAKTLATKAQLLLDDLEK
ncbi:hypothetical protein JAO29_13755 [Edaphobacter sp. HDX4]|uniref:hypothetical protein n=1 Tax=Edaphobacter sp. HDX4 TaxID=2794064 RepID=UPI002FE5ECB4